MGGSRVAPRVPLSRPQESNWFGRNWKWAVPVGCLGILIAGCVFVVLLVSVVFGFIKSSDAYTEAVSRAQASPAVAEALGTPIEPGFFVTGNINVSGSSGQADLAIPISGPKGSATLYAQATKSAGQWSYSLLQVSVSATDEQINLLAEGGTP